MAKAPDHPAAVRASGPPASSWDTSRSGRRNTRAGATRGGSSPASVGAATMPSRSPRNTANSRASPRAAGRVRSRVAASGVPAAGSWRRPATATRCTAATAKQPSGATESNRPETPDGSTDRHDPPGAPVSRPSCWRRCCSGQWNGSRRSRPRMAARPVSREHGGLVAEVGREGVLPAGPASFRRRRLCLHRVPTRRGPLVQGGRDSRRIRPEVLFVERAIVGDDERHDSR